MKWKTPVYYCGIMWLLSLYGCGTSGQLKKTTAITPDSIASIQAGSLFLEKLMQTRPQYFSDVLNNRKAWKVQVIYTKIDRKQNNEPVFTPYYFNVDSVGYFYPASTVKFPVALLALQHLHELNLPGIDKSNSVITEAAYSKQAVVYNDPKTIDGRPTIAQYIKKIFLVSDNEAFNRLYELMGQQYINDQLHKMGYADAAILHRLQISMTADENRHTNPVALYDSTGNLLFRQPMLFNEKTYAQRKDSAGNAYYNGETLVQHAMDFSGKNRISIKDLTDVLRRFLFPMSVSPQQRFNFTDEDYRFVKQYMSQWPTETIYPPYTDTARFWPALGKFLLFGAAKAQVPQGIRIFNKIGGAYGFLSDVAYIVDFDKNVEFMLSASIYCNTDGVLNDDKYDYDSIGYPFLKQVGQLIYDYELSRPRAVKPDLTAFKMTYDK